MPPPPEAAPPPTVTPEIVDGCPGEIKLKVDQPPAPPKKIHSHTINLKTGAHEHSVRDADEPAEAAKPAEEPAAAEAEE